MGKSKKHRSKRNPYSGVVFVLVSLAAVSVAILITVILCFTTGTTHRKSAEDTGTVSSEDPAVTDARAVEALGLLTMPDYVETGIIDVGRARRGIKLTGIHNIVLHYTANPGTTAEQNRHYFSLEDTEVCSHFVVGIDGKIIQCVPLDEQSAASNFRNVDTISIEVCHADDTGRFSPAAYNSSIKLITWLCKQTGLDETDLIRHYDVTGKICPKYFVEHEDKWEKYKSDVGKSLSEFNEE